MEKKGGLTRREQIERDKAEIERLQNRVKENEAKEREKERKARTKRLIEIGAVVESVAGHPIEKEQLEKFKQWLIKHLEKPIEKESPSKANGQENQSVTSTKDGMPPSGLPSA